MATHIFLGLHQAWSEEEAAGPSRESFPSLRRLICRQCASTMPDYLTFLSR